jgi:hypothetical protein
MRSKHALASKIVEIFRGSLRGMLGSLSARALHYTLPFVRDGSFISFTIPHLTSLLDDAFGSDIFRSLLDISYNTKATSMVRRPVHPTSNTHNVQTPPMACPAPMAPAEQWPQLVSEQVKLKCMREYLKNSTWRKPAVCAVCGRDRYGMSVNTYDLLGGNTLPANFRSLLSVPRHSMHYNHPHFLYGHVAVDNMMLCREGLSLVQHDRLKVDVCSECLQSIVLKNRALPKLPKFSLANKLYLGSLPKQFDDVTWVEEQVCAVYRSTIFVYRLYHSDNPQDPFMAKGNSCAHPQNTVSTAYVLPRTPADVAGTIRLKIYFVCGSKSYRTFFYGSVNTIRCMLTLK